MVLKYSFFKVTAEFYLESSDEWDTDGYYIDYEYEVDDKAVYTALAEDAARQLPKETTKEQRKAYTDGYVAALEEYDMLDDLDKDHIKELFKEEAEDAFMRDAW